MMTILPEFQQVEGKNAFVKNHPVPPFEKDVWKKTLTLAEQWGHYEGAFTKSVGLLDELNASLVELDKLVYSTEYCTEGTVPWPVLICLPVRFPSLFLSYCFLPRIMMCCRPISSSSCAPVSFLLHLLCLLLFLTFCVFLFFIICSSNFYFCRMSSLYSAPCTTDDYSS